MDHARSVTEIISLVSIFPFLPILFFFFVTYSHLSFFSAALAVSSRILLVLRERPFRPLRSHLSSRASVSLTSWSTAPSPPSALLTRPLASAVRDTSSRMSKGDEMRRLVGFHGDQPACTGISRLNHRCLSRRVALSLSLAPRIDAGRHGGNRRNRTVRAESGSSEFHRAPSSERGRRLSIFER